MSNIQLAMSKMQLAMFKMHTLAISKMHTCNV